jgi:hypothetical protein
MMVRNSSLGQPALDRFLSRTRGPEQIFGRFTRKVLTVLGMVGIGDFVEGTVK